MYCLRVFYKSYIVYYNVYIICSFKTMSLPSLVLIGGSVRELHAHLYPYRNLRLEAVYCYFAMFTKY